MTASASSKASQSIFAALPIVAAAYGEKFGVKVIVGGQQAMTDGQTIVVPNVQGDRFGDALWGYLAHEAAHVRMTDFEVGRDEIARSDFLRTMLNTFEDCRIEREMIKLYPGTARTLNAVAAYMVDQGHYQIPTRDTHPAGILEAYCLYFLQCKVVGQHAIEDTLVATTAVYEQVIPKGVQVRLAVLLGRAGQLKSTADALVLSREVLRMVEEEAQKEQDAQQPAPQSQPSLQDSTQPQAGSGQAGGQGSAGGDAGNAQGTGSGSSSAQGPDQGAPTGSASSTGDDADASSPGVMQQILDARADDHLKDKTEALRADLNSGADQTAPVVNVPTALEVMNDQASGQMLIGQVAAASSRIQSQLMGLVQASQRNGYTPGRHGRHLDTNRLHRLVSGDTRIFRRSAERKHPDTAVHLLVDMSSSMDKLMPSGEHVYEVARDAAMALALGLEKINGVNPAVTFFCKNSRQPVWSVVKHGQKVSRNAGRFSFSPDGRTPMTEAIWYSAFELSKTRERRKMVLVVTDGEPNNVGSCQHVVQLCQRSGIEMIGIGVGKGAKVASLFASSIQIESVNDLKHTLFQLMSDALTGVAV
ncbi:VWA domain-containing protein [Pseudomonas luteola]|uniref:Nitric oxide reductase activation protein n=1 Tax=Pseudomonas luteola TaxID=47886 RepID=A0A2X2CJ88_PSELU|nr:MULTISPECIES: VWA domain-containing protein [Pseudomonas]SHJ71501.1 von Willebrand factor type A domain-containing protein [Pseudomonas zeshuii]SPZ00245.1 Nitric oxide reductase activation protein [Pseudomonas luteola]